MPQPGTCSLPTRYVINWARIASPILIHRGSTQPPCFAARHRASAQTDFASFKLIMYQVRRIFTNIVRRIHNEQKQHQHVGELMSCTINMPLCSQITAFQARGCNMETSSMDFSVFRRMNVNKSSLVQDRHHSKQCKGSHQHLETSHNHVN